MVLVDKDIKERGESLIVEGYDVNNVSSISYDLVVDSIIEPSDSGKANKSRLEFELLPQEFVFIKMKEKVKIPHNLTGRIIEKNSIMRKGIVITGPQYQPGHTTNIFLRAQNISGNQIRIASGEKYAQIIFEELTGEPFVSYNENEKSSFNEEFEYRGFGKYKETYNSAIKRIEKKEEDLLNTESRLYGNILTLMGIFISLFSLVSLNFQIFTSPAIPYMDLPRIVSVMNLSVLLAIFVLFQAIFTFTNKEKINRNYWIKLTINVFVVLILGILIYYLAAGNKYQILVR